MASFAQHSDNANVQIHVNCHVDEEGNKVYDSIYSYSWCSEETEDEWVDSVLRSLNIELNMMRDVHMNIRGNGFFGIPIFELMPSFDSPYIMTDTLFIWDPEDGFTNDNGYLNKDPFQDMPDQEELKHFQENFQLHRQWINDFMNNSVDEIQIITDSIHVIQPSQKVEPKQKKPSKKNKAI